jgi:hypothetical protein
MKQSCNQKKKKKKKKRKNKKQGKNQNLLNKKNTEKYKLKKHLKI